MSQRVLVAAILLRRGAGRVKCTASRLFSVFSSVGLPKFSQPLLWSQCLTSHEPHRTSLLLGKNCSEVVEEYLERLQRVIQHAKCEHTVSSDSEVIMNREDAFCQSQTIAGRSPFSTVFRHACDDAKEKIDAEQSSEEPSDDNLYYCPGIVKILLDNYMPIFPLRSGIMLGDLTQPAVDINKKNLREQEEVNDECTDQKEEEFLEDRTDKTREKICHVKQWFGIVKHHILRKKKTIATWDLHQNHAQISTG